MTTTKNTVRELKENTASFTCIQQDPTITGIDPEVASKIEKSLKEYYANVWKEINEQSKDEEIQEILKTSGKDIKNYSIGFEQSFSILYSNDKIVTFSYVMTGGLGGVSWGTTSGVSYSLDNGEIIEPEDIIKDKKGYIEACKNTVYKQLKADERYPSLNQGYEKIVDEAIEKVGGYFTETGIVCVQIPKYGISYGAAGEFSYEISYNDAKNYIDIDKIK